MLHAFKRMLESVRAKRPGTTHARKKPKRIRLDLEPLEDRTAPAVLTVNSVADNTTSDSSLTLREAILVVDGTLGRALSGAEQAQVSGTLGSSDTVNFSLPAGPQTITLTGGALGITGNVTINGPGANLTLSANNASRVFFVGQSSSQNLGLVVSISGLTVANSTDQYGGGLFNAGTLTLSNVAFTNNTATTGGGGGVYNNGALTLNNCTFTSNTSLPNGPSATAGGGLLNLSAGTVTATNCTFSGNAAAGTGAAAGQGGGIANSGTMTISGSSITGNTATFGGGGVYSGTGSLTLTNCTLSNNTVLANAVTPPQGGGLLNEMPATVSLIGCTFSGNSAQGTGQGGGVFNSGGTLTVNGCSFTSNTAASYGGAYYAPNAGGNNPVMITNTTFTNNSTAASGGAIANLASMTVSGSTLTGNTSTSAGGGIYNSGSITLTGTTITGSSCGPSAVGGGMFNGTGATVTFTDCTVSNNSAGGSGTTASAGGGLYAYGTVNMTRTTFSNNVAASDAGAIYSNNTLVINSCNLINNTSNATGGAIYVKGSFTMTGSNVSGNTSGANAGGIEVTGATVANISNSTIANNTAPSSGGGLINFNSPVVMTNVTVTGNRVIFGSGGSFGGGLRASTPITLQNCIVAGNFRGTDNTASDTSGSYTSDSSYNIIGTGGAGGLVNGTNNNQVGVTNPGLGALTIGAGPVPTIPLLGGSPAFNGGSNAFVTAGATDERGFPRIANGTVDIGAFESQMSSTAPAGQTANQGISKVLNLGSFVDPTAATGPWTVEINWGDGTANTIFSVPTKGVLPTQSHAFALGGTLTVGVSVTNGTADASQATFQVSVTPTAAATFLVSGFPSLVTTGIANTFTVRALDANGLTANGYRGKIHFTSTDTTATLPADYTFTAADNGVHTFTATLKALGVQSITATDTVVATITGTQSGIQVNSASPAVLTVNSTADNTTADNVLTLREAIAITNGNLGRALTPAEQLQLAGTLGASNTISFGLPAGPQTITLTAGALNLTKNVTISGPGAANLTINANNLSRVLVVGTDWSPNASLVAAISGVTISGGGNAAYGGGLLNFGTLTVNNCVFFGNTAGSSGGGAIYNVVSLNVQNTTFTGNSVGANSKGGGLYNYSAGSATITGCSFTNNTAGGSGSTGSSGAGISNSGTLQISWSTFTNNTAASTGGGIYNAAAANLTVTTSTFSSNNCGADGAAIDQDGIATITYSTFAFNNASSESGAIDSDNNSTLTLSNCTLYGNIAGSDGGAMAIASPVTITNCTFTANRVTRGSGGVFGGGIYAQTVLPTLRNTIVAGNFQGASPSTTANDIAGSVAASSVNNLIGIGGSGGLTNNVNGNQVGVSNPGLGALADNGGPTKTVALLSGSPAIDQGNNTYVTTGQNDQRGYARIANSTVDIGAFEVQSPFSPNNLAVTGFPTQPRIAIAYSFTVTVKDSLGNTVPSYAGTVHFTSSDPLASLPADYTFVSGDNGVKSFSATLNSYGTYSLTATDLATPGVTGTESGIQVNSTAATMFTVSGFLSPAAAGVASTFTVTAKDANGNIKTDYTGTVQFTSSDTKAGLPNEYQFLSSDQGVHTFSATLKTAGTQSLTATDKNNSTMIGAQTGIVINPAAASKLVVTTQPSSNATAGVAFATQPVVAEVDDFGNIINDSSHTVTVSLGGLGTAGLQGSNLTVSLVGGVATFSGLSYNMAETINLGFSTNASGVSAVSSSNIVVSPGSASQLLITTQPSTSATAGVVFATQPVLAEEDAYGNIINDSTNTVTVTRGNLGTAALQGGSFTVTFAGGIANFSGLSYNKAETINLSFTSSVPGLNSVTSGNITVNPASASQLVMSTQPSGTATAGVAFATQPVVAEEDAFGNIINDNTHIVTATSTGTASLQGNTSVTLTGGIASFSGLSYNKAESMSISFSADAPGVSSITSTSIIVSSASSQLVVSSQPAATATAGVAFATQPTLTMLDSLGNVINDSTHTVTVFSTGTAALLGTTTVPLINGVATFTDLSYNKAETFSLQFTTDAPGVSGGTSNSIVISPAAASQLVITTQPSTMATAGVAFATQPVVAEEDAFGNIVNDSTSTVTVARGNLGSAALQGGQFTVILSGGVATFSGLSYNKAEPINLNFTTNAAGVSSVPSGNIVVSPAAASKLVVTTQPSTTATAGVAFATQPVVAEQDNFGNTVNDNTSTVTATRGSLGSAALQGGPLTVTLSGGVATFTGLSYNKAETINLNFTTNAAGVSSIASGNIVVSPAAASKLVVTTQPSTTATAGVAFATQPVVAEQDNFGNIINDSVSTVTVARGSLGTAGLQGSPLTVTMSGGVANFGGLFYNKAEAINLNFTTNAAGVSSITSGNILVSPASASTFTVAGFPSPSAKGVSGSFTVTAKDAFGNTATGYAGTVGFTSSDLAASLPGNSSLASGVGSFNATFNTVGTQSLTATDSANSITGSQTGIVVNSSNAAVLTVNSTADNTTADSVLTLREAIAVVNGNLGRPLTAGEQAQMTGVLGSNNTVQFNLPSGPQTIALGGSVLQITKAVTITGPGANNLTINANKLSRVFLVGQIFTQNLSLVVAMSGLTVTGGSALSGSNNYGAGLLNFGTLTLNNVVFSGNAAGSSGGGGIYNKGALAVSNCTFSSNSMTGSGSGGAIQNASASTLTVTGSTFSTNKGISGGSGGGIANSGKATVSTSTFTANSAAGNGAGLSNSVTGKLTLVSDTFVGGTATSDGGGFDNDGTVTATNCTFSGNSAGSEGGAVDNHGIMTLINCTLVGNTATSRGGAINNTLESTPSNSLQVTNCTITGNRTTNGSSGRFGGGLYNTVPARLQNTIIAGNFQSKTGSNPNDIYGNVDTTSSFNLIGTGGSGGMVNGVNNNLVGVSNPGLGALANNGGPVQTVMLLAGSPARGRGSNAFVTSGQTDARGFARIVNGSVDIGALEVQITSTPPADQGSKVGAATAFALGSFVDTTVGASPWSIDINWGDGSSHTTFATNTTGTLTSQSHTYLATGAFTVTVTITDANNDLTVISFRVTVTP